MRMLARALETFDNMATFGSRKNIEGARQSVIKQIMDDYEVYASLNQSRNPLAGLEVYVIIHFFLGVDNPVHIH